MHTPSFSQTIFMVLPILTGITHAHSWIERINVLSNNGTMIGNPGFPRGNVLRTSPSFNDGTMVNLIPPNGGAVNIIDPGQLMCRASQTTQTQTDGSPRLKAAPGAFVALRYQENGHVSLPQNQPGKPPNRGTNFVYYTTQSKSSDLFLGIHRQWTADGKGGDGRGRLISMSNFDDGQCYQINGGDISKQRQTEFPHTADQVMGADLWCQQDIEVPADAPVGSTITLYWVWDWPTMPGTAGFANGKQEIYTTCMDIDIVAGVPAVQKAVPQGFSTTNFVSAAAKTQFPNIADPTAVISPGEIPFSGVSTLASSASPASTVVQVSSPVISQSIGTVTASVAPTSVNSSPATVTIYQPTTVTVTSVAAASSPTSSSSSAVASPSSLMASSSSSPLASPSLVQGTTPQASVVTSTQMDFVTTKVYNTIVEKRDISCTYAETSSITSSSSATPCSKTEPAYRLKARMPFYALSGHEPESTGC